MTSINHDKNIEIIPELSNPQQNGSSNIRYLVTVKKKLIPRKKSPFKVKSPYRGYYRFFFFIIISITIGVLTVYFTLSKSEDICVRTFQGTIGNAESSDSHPQSVAIGYINNDTKLDFVIANTDGDSITVFIGYENGTFANQTTYSTGDGSQPSSVALANFDNNTGDDVAVANFGTNSIRIFLGFYNGNFTIQKSFSTGSSHPLFITASDLNNDNRLDIAVVNYGTNSVSIFIGFGNGSFVFETTYSTGYDSLPKSLAIGDLNNDNQLDIVVANYGTNNIGIFYGYENGSFQEQKIYSTGIRSNPSSIVITDINKDNQLDIIVVNSGTRKIGIFFGYGNESFASQVMYSTGTSSHPEFVSIGNFNQDNHLDIAITDSNNDKVYILPGNENGTFPKLTVYYTGFQSSPFSLAVGDFNNTNRSDLLVINRDSNNLLALMQYEQGQSVNYTTYSTGKGSFPRSIAIGDLNHDNSLDLVVTYSDANSLGIYFGYENGSFVSFATLSTGNNSVPWSVELGDFNNDHQLDIVVANVRATRVDILLGHGNGSFSLISTYSTETKFANPSLAVNDLNNDNCLDIVFTSSSASVIGVLLGYCNGTFAPITTFDLKPNSDPTSVATGDFNNDKRLDVIVSNVAAASIGVFLGHGDGTFARVMTYETGVLPGSYSITSADFNNDHQIDIAVTLTSANSVGIFFGHGNGTFQNIRVYPLETGRFPTSIAVGDLNNDHQLDIIVSDFASNDITILFGKNNGDFPTQVTYPTGDRSNPDSLKLGDFNNDQQLDIAVANYAADTIGIFISYNSANFIVERNYFTDAGSHPYSIVVGDFNMDNQLDIVVVNSEHDNVGIRLGYGNGTFGIETTYSTGPGSFPKSVNLDDFNRDDQLDIVITNSQNDSISIFFGYNNGSFGNQMIYSTGFQSNPNLVAVGDFNNDKWLDLVVTNEKSADIGIFYGFNYTTFDSPQIYFIGNGAISYSVCVDDFNNDNRLDIAVVNAGYGDVSIFFGYGNGTFREQVWYSVGRYAFPRGVTSGDFNNDHCQDIVVANQNTNSVGILFGYCNGSFTSVTTYAAGNGSVPQSLAVGDINNDNQLDIVIAKTGINNIGVLLGSGNGIFSEIVIFSTGLESQLTSIVLGDFNNDNCLDIAITDTIQDNVGILLGHGDGSFDHIITYPTGSGSIPASVTLGDFNNDNQIDMAVACPDTNNVALFYGFGNGSFSSREEHSTGSNSFPVSVATGDFNEDNQTDIAVICLGNHAITILFGLGYGKFLIGKKYSIDDSSFPIAIAVGNFNNDSRLDIVLSDAQTNNVGVFLGNGNEYFSTVTTILTGLDLKPHSVAVGDFNNDNRSDIVIGNYEIDNIIIVLADDNAKFSEPMTYPTGNGSHPYSVVIGDFNGDDQLDIFVANSGTDDVIVFQGYGNGMFSKIGSYSTGIASLPYSIAINDFNNDKQMDIAVVNSGTNNILILYGFGNGTFGNETSHSLGYNSRPYSLAVGDFNNDSWMDIAIANYGTDSVEILLKIC